MYNYISLILFAFYLLFSPQIFAQCPTQNISGNLIATNGQVLSGTYNITGVFYVPAGVTAFVEAHSINACGELQIYADSIRIDGTLSAVGAGFEGGLGGAAGYCTDSLRFQDCSLNAQCMGITPVTFGAAGTDGLGLGFGNGGANGTNGSGRKNSCNANSDRVGRVGGSGGGGGGAGGSYGGIAANAGAGSAANLPAVSANSPANNCAPANTVAFVAGVGGIGGLITVAYGTPTGNDWALGSGGGGAAGGGRGYFFAQNGENGGNGGGAIKLIAVKGCYISGNVLADGAVGGKGGDGGDGGESPRCCIDLCPQVNEHTYVGAGGGGAGGGGGSGGAIWMDAGGSLQIFGLVSANGGVLGAGGIGGAGDSAAYQEPAFICGSASGLYTTVTIAPAANGNNGGSGGGGRVKIFYDDCAWNGFSGIVQADSGGVNATNGSVYLETKPTTFAIGNINTAQNPQTICAITGTGVPFTAPAADTFFLPLYQWQLQNDCAGVWTNIVGANNLVYTPSALADTACFRLVVTSGNCSGIYQDTFQVNTIPAPSYNLDANNLFFCAGNSDTLSIVSALPVGATIQWYHNGNAIAAGNGGNSTPIIVSLSGNYYATISSAGTCTGNTDTANVTVFNAPFVNITPQSSTTFCAGGSVVLTCSLSVSYQWFLNGNPIGGNTQNLTATVSGNYTVQVTNSNNCSATSAIVVVTVNPKPTANIVANGATTFCTGGNVTLTASGGGTYNWFFNNGVNGNNTSTQNAAASGAYFVEVTNAFLCKDSSAILNVTVNPLPNATINASNTTFCVGDSIMIVATGGGNYQWQNPIISTNDTLFVNQNGIFCVTVTNAITNCSTSICSPQITQAVNPMADIQTAAPTTICAGDTVHFTTTASLTNQWLLNGNPIAGATGQNLAVTQAGVYSVIAIFSQNCRDTSANMNVTVQPSPTLSIVPLTNLTLCVGDTIFLAANGGNNYVWLTPSGNINVDTIAITLAGNYQVVGTNNIGTCPDTSAITGVLFYPLPMPTINIASGTNPFCMGDSVELSCNGYASYQWFENGIILAGETNNTLTVYNAGTYSVAVIDGNGCTGTSTGILVQTSTMNLPIITGDGLLCAGESTLLQTTGNFTTYQWTLNGVNLSNNANLQVSQAGNYVLTVSFGACISSSTPFAVNFAPKPSITITPNDTVRACNFVYPVLLVASGANTYQWYKNNAILNGQTNDSLYINSFAAYCVIGSNTEGCKDTAEKTVILQAPTATATIQTVGNLAICEGDSTALIANGGNVIAWLLNGIFIPNSIGKSTLYATSAGEYSLVVADSCGNDTSNLPVTITYITVSAAFSYLPTDIYTLSQVQFTNESSTTGNLSWQWNFGDGNFSAVKNPRHVYATTDSFLVTLIVSLPSGCSDTVSHGFFVYTKGSLYFPNVFTPNGDGENDIWKAQGLEVVSFALTLYDRWGREMTTFSALTDFWDGTDKGKPAQEGVYAYQYKAVLRDGRSLTNGGTVTLIR